MANEQQIGARLARVFSLAGKTALITGAGSGLGRATANLFAEVGAQVVVADLMLDAAKATVAQIEANGGEALDQPVVRAGMRRAKPAHAPDRGSVTHVRSPQRR